MSSKCTSVIVYTLKNPGDALWTGRSFHIDDESGAQAYAEECRKNKQMTVLVRRIETNIAGIPEANWEDGNGFLMVAAR